jgi:hypothetical protein
MIAVWVHQEPDTRPGGHAAPALKAAGPEVMQLWQAVFASANCGTPQDSTRDMAARADGGGNGREMPRDWRVKDGTDDPGGARTACAGSAASVPSPTVASADASDQTTARCDRSRDSAVAVGPVGVQAQAVATQVEPGSGSVSWSAPSGHAAVEQPSGAGRNTEHSPEPTSRAARPGQPTGPVPAVGVSRSGSSVSMAKASGAARHLGAEGQRLEQLAAPSEESVLVRQTTDGVEVTVRHATLEAHAAVWYAMETAQQLTGNRKALHQVTLNGRRVYEDERRVDGPANRVRFHC